jgi:hypothetical protein
MLKTIIFQKTQKKETRAKQFVTAPETIIFLLFL